MTDPMIAIALAGTSRQERIDLATGTPLDELLNQLPQNEVERTFLLAAGAWALYRQAGTQATPASAPMVPAGPESLRVCSPAAAGLIEMLLRNDTHDLLSLALEY